MVIVDKSHFKLSHVLINNHELCRYLEKNKAMEEAQLCKRESFVSKNRAVLLLKALPAHQHSGTITYCGESEEFKVAIGLSRTTGTLLMQLS